MKWFTSDWHLDHEFVMKVSERPWTDVNKMNKDIIDNMLSVLRPGDEMYFLGDLSWRRQSLDEFFNKFPRNVNFHWILGNHDKKNWQPFKSRCSSVGYMKRIKIIDNTVILCHWPMLTWDKSHFNSWMLFGHHHKNSHGTDRLEELATGKMFNVTLEFNNYMPYSEKDIIEIMDKKPDNWDLIKGR